MNHTEVQRIEANDKPGLRRFISFEKSVHKENRWFVPEIDADVNNCLSGRSSYYDEMEYKIFIATCDDKDASRCTALINRRYQEAKGEAIGFIGHFAAAPDRDSQVREMIGQAETWLKERGVTRIVAPYNGAGILGMGLLTAAFDEAPMFPFNWHPPYYNTYLTESGYQPTYPLWYYTIDFTSDKYQAVKQRTLKNHNVVVRPINKKLWNQDLETYRQLFNAAFIDEWEFHPLTSDEFHEFFDPMKPVLEAEQMLIGEVEGNAAGFCLGQPDWSPLFRSFKGKMGPIQIFRLLFSANRYSRAGLLGIGVLPDYRGSGLAQSLAVKLYKRYENHGLKQAFYYPVNDDNTRSRKFAESMGGTGRIIYHCYDKQIS